MNNIEQSKRDIRTEGSARGARESNESMTRDELWELERNRSRSQEAGDLLISVLPFAGLAAALMEYLLVPDKYNNQHPERYIIFLLIPAAVYLARWLRGQFWFRRGNRKPFAAVCHSAPFLTAIYIAMALFDWATLKTGLLLYPFIPWINDIINAIILDKGQLAVCTLYSVRLLMLGYLSGSFLGLITGVACGYSRRVYYWVNPIVRILGPIPTATWIPLIMLLVKSLTAGSIFIVGLGAWFAVTVATTAGIGNVDRDYLEAARTLGASERQLVFRIAIPGAMPSILQGMTQAMSSSCVSLVIAEMMGVKAGLGWYITWQKSWAAYNKMFAAILIICIVFNVVTRIVEMVRKHMLRWQTGGAQNG